MQAHEHLAHQLQAPPLSAPDHRPCGVALLSLSAEPALGRGNALERGIVVSYETIRRWGLKFGPDYARRLRRKRPGSNDIWHLDEVVISIAGKKHWLWRAVDQDGYVLDEIVQNRRNTKAAKRLLMRLLKKQGVAPKRMITNKLRSYGAARRQVMPAVEHRSHKGLDNRAENSHLPLRKRERIMQGYRSSGGLQRFLLTFS